MLGDDRASPEVAARAALRRLYDDNPEEVRDASGDAIVSVEDVGPRRLVLTSRYEERTITYEFRREREPSPHEQEAPDPWSVELTRRPDAQLADASLELEGIDVRQRCPVCADGKEIDCGTCTAGQRHVGGERYPCERCEGRGVLPCTSCEWGIHYGRPTVRSSFGKAEAVRVLEPTELPVEVLFDVMDGEGGIVVHEQEGEPRIERLELATSPQGYRAPARLRDERLGELASELLAEPRTPAGTALRHQHLQITMVPAWVLRFEGGDDVVLYGEPPKCHPPDALRPRSWLKRLLPWA